MNNKKETATLMYGFLLLIVADVLFAIFGKKLLHLENQVFYCIFLLVLIFSVWRIVKLRIFFLSASQHILSVEYYHPFANKKGPVLEIPLQKVISLKFGKGLINNKLNVAVRTRKGIRTFSYQIGKWHDKDINNIDHIMALIEEARSE